MLRASAMLSLLLVIAPANAGFIDPPPHNNLQIALPILESAPFAALPSAESRREALIEAATQIAAHHCGDRSQLFPAAQAVGYGLLERTRSPRDIAVLYATGHLLAAARSVDVCRFARETIPPTAR